MRLTSPLLPSHPPPPLPAPTRAALPSCSWAPTSTGPRWTCGPPAASCLSCSPESRCSQAGRAGWGGVGVAHWGGAGRLGSCGRRWARCSESAWALLPLLPSWRGFGSSSSGCRASCLPHHLPLFVCAWCVPQPRTPQGDQLDAPGDQPVHVGFGLPCFPAGKDEGDQLDKILSIMGQPTEASMPVRPAGAAARWRGRLGQRLCSNSEEASILRTTATAASRCVGLAKHQVRHCPGHAAGLHNVGPLQHGAAQPVPCALPPQSSEHMLLLCWRCRRVSQRRWLVSVP